MFSLYGRLILRGIKELFRHPWLQTLTLAAVMLVTLLSGLFLMVLYNLDVEIKKSQGQVQLQVFWEVGADMEQVRNQWNDLSQLPSLTGIKTFTPEQALNVLSDSMSLKTDLSVLKERQTLPPTALLDFSLPEKSDGRWAQDMLIHLRGLPAVEKVHYNPLQVDMAQSWIQLSRKIIWPLIIFLGLMLSLIVGNTIKLSLLNRKEEVEILRLVGASRFYIQLPLLAGGAFQGFIGSVVALGMLKGIQLGIKDLLNFPPLWLNIQFLPPEHMVVVIAALTLVGLFSSWVAVRF